MIAARYSAWNNPTAKRNYALPNVNNAVILKAVTMVADKRFGMAKRSWRGYNRDCKEAAGDRRDFRIARAEAADLRWSPWSRHTLNWVRRSRDDDQRLPALSVTSSAHLAGVCGAEGMKCSNHNPWFTLWHAPIVSLQQKEKLVRSTQLSSHDTAPPAYRVIEPSQPRGHGRANAAFTEDGLKMC